MNILGVAGPLLSNPYAANKSRVIIYDQDFSMRAVVDLAKRVPLKGAEPTKLYACIFHMLDELLVDFTAPERVHEYIYLHAAPRLTGKCPRKLISNIATPIHIRQE
ncbi:hypothetical protein D9M70_540030 [compost metagenome]